MTIEELSQKEPIPRCQAMIYKRDTYRRTGRGRIGMEMHYEKCQCSRRASVGKFCKTHSRDGYTECPWADEYIDNDN